jgi:hypothetical protein
VLNNVEVTEDIFENNLLYNITINDEDTKKKLNSKKNSTNNTENSTNCKKGDKEQCKDCRTEINEQYKCNSCNDGYYIPNDLKNPIKCRKCFKDCKTCENEYMKCTSCNETNDFITLFIKINLIFYILRSNKK